MKIAFIGQLFKGSTSLDRVHSLQELGHEVIGIDTSAFTSTGPRVEMSVAHRLNWGRPICRINKYIETMTPQAGQDLDLLWFDKAKWVWPETISKLKEKTGAQVLHFTPDPHFLNNRSRHFNRSLPLFDYVFTTKRYELEHYQRFGAKHIALIDQGFAPKCHFPRILTSAEWDSYKSDITFIGHGEAWYVEILSALVRAGLRTKIWGPAWHRHLGRPEIRAAYQGGPLWGDDYAKALSAAKIGLGLLSKLASDQSTTRSFEIPACGTLLLAERTEEHENLYRDKIEAAFFSTADEAIALAKSFFSDEQQRLRVAKAGHERCKNAYSNNDRMRQLLAQLS